MKTKAFVVIVSNAGKAIRYDYDSIDAAKKFYDEMSISVDIHYLALYVYLFDNYIVRDRLIAR